MKKVILIIALSLTASFAYADAKEVITATTKNVIKFGKDFMKGLNDGVDEGREGAEGADGSITVTNIEGIEQYITVKVLSVKGINNTETEVVVGFTNRESKPVRIANMDDKGIVLLIDSDGYSQELSNSNRYKAEITVPPKTGKKHTFVFNLDIKKAAKIRLWSKEYDLAKHLK